MSDLSYDPELLNLFLQSTNSPSGANRTLNLLNSELLGYLSGGFNPMTQVGGSGSSPLMRTYESDPNPVMQQIIAHIKGGTDPYRLSSFVDDLIGGNTTEVANLGFQPEDLKNLAIAMNKEYTGTGGGGTSSRGSSKGGFDFAGAGLSSPLDVYDETNTPMTPATQKLLQEAMGRSSKVSEQMASAKDRSRKAKSELGPMFGKKFNTKELVEFLKNDPEGKLIAKESGVDFQKVDPETGEIYGWKTSRDRGGSMWNPLSWVDDAITNVSRTAEIIAKQNVMGGKPKYIENKVGYGKPEDPQKLYEYEQAQLDEAALRDQEFKAQKMEEAVKRGIARAMRDSGRTPLGDELKQRLALVAKLNK